MRLTAINLQGFKSFPDKTSFVINGGLTGVVGPNGCGKSNLLDAMRWGLGESRAAALRGGALQDVLFSGTDKRAAADWCVIEMRFANDKKADWGMWSAYPEIIVKRELGREGQSYFYINNQSVRRRDVVDLFRGTGVSPRSYAVVEQGMVGLIAEASPESLRQFLEDAAGVSHYKDRRRDTERRLAGSTVNLEQINQLLDDTRRRCESLKRQARAAQRYRQISEAINDLEVLLIINNRAQAESVLAVKREELFVAQSGLNAARQQIETLRDSGEKARARHAEMVQLAQERQNTATRAQSAAEQALRNCAQAKEKRAHLQSRLLADRKEQEEAVAALQQSVVERKQCTEDLAGISGELERRLAESEGRADELAKLQKGLRQAELVMESAREGVSVAQRRREALELRQYLAEEQKVSLRRRLSDLQAVQEKLNDADDAAPPSPDDTKQEVERLESEASRLAGDCRALAATVENTRAVARVAENKLVTEEAKYVALQALVSDERSWRKGAPPRLVDTVRPQAGEWAVALDAALGRYINGYAVESIDSFLATKGLPPSGSALVEISASPPPAKARRRGWRTLLSCIEASTGGALLVAWLDGAYVADSVQDAQAMRLQLVVGETVFTREGVVFTRESVFVCGKARGGFDWRQRLSTLANAVAAAKESLAGFFRKAEGAKQQLRECEKTYAEVVAALESARTVLSERRIACSQWEERCRSTAARRREIADEMSAGEARLQKMTVAADATDIAQIKNNCAGADNALLAAKNVMEEATAALEKSRGEFHHLAMARRELHVREENLKQRAAALKVREEECRRRCDALRARNRQNESDVAGLAEPLLMLRAQELKKHAAATEQTARQAAAEALTWERRAAAAADERERQFADFQKHQEKYAALQVVEKEAAMRVEGLNNSLEEFSVDEARLTVLRQEKADIPPAARRAEIDALFEKRKRLGAINFAAASELDEAGERLDKLQHERDDVETAMAELQTTIRRLDAETRNRLREMHESVNRRFAALFQQLFGGGDAALVMEGDSILDAGFEIRARLPGKRMFPVRMLSGGEKSTTALAFIFALMQKNSPPFCIMDEVDAALDDVRVESFLSLLRDLSANFQCVVITHNKSTIEAMDALIGVTQEEKGVSKVVSVQLDDALRQTA